MTRILVKETISGRSIQFWTDAIFASADDLTNGLASSTIYGFQWNPKLDDPSETQPFTHGGNVAWSTPVVRSNSFLPYPELLPHNFPRNTVIRNIFPVTDTQLVLFGTQDRFASHDGNYAVEQASGFWVVTFATDGTITVSEPFVMWYQTDLYVGESGPIGDSVTNTAGTRWFPGPWVLASPTVLRILDLGNRGDLLLNVAATGVTIARQPPRRSSDNYFGDVTFTGSDTRSIDDINDTNPGLPNPFVTRRADQCWYALRTSYSDPAGQHIIKVDPDGTRALVLITQDDPTLTFGVTNLAMIGPKRIAVSGYRYPKICITGAGFGGTPTLAAAMQWCVYDVNYTTAVDVDHATSVYHSLAPAGAPHPGSGPWCYQVIDMPDDDFAGSIVLRRQGFYTGSGGVLNDITSGTGGTKRFEVSVWNYPDLDTSYSAWVRVLDEGGGVG